MAQIRAVVIDDLNMIRYGYIDNTTNDFYHDGNWQSRTDADQFYYPLDSKLPENKMIKAGKYTAL